MTQTQRAANEQTYFVHSYHRETGTESMVEIVATDPDEACMMAERQMAGRMDYCEMMVCDENGITVATYGPDDNAD